MDRGAWWATVHGVTKEPDVTEQLNLTRFRRTASEPICHPSPDWCAALGGGRCPTLLRNCPPTSCPLGSPEGGLHPGSPRRGPSLRFLLQCWDSVRPSPSCKNTYAFCHYFPGHLRLVCPGPPLPRPRTPLMHPDLSLLSSGPLCLAASTRSPLQTPGSHSQATPHVLPDMGSGGSNQPQGH